MSIRVRGTITIQRKTSARGAFNIGDLATEIGEFEVKDSLIEEFEPGKYTGDFLIRWIAPDSFAWRGRVFVKNRATLDEILIDEADESVPAPSAPPEIDPIEEKINNGSALAAPAMPTPAAIHLSAPETAPQPDTASTASRAGKPGSRGGHSVGAIAGSKATPSTEPSAALSVALSVAPSDAEADLQLFGDEVHAFVLTHAVIKLDPTVDRERFRQQRDRLRALGYAFDPKSQSWSVKATRQAVPV